MPTLSTTSPGRPAGRWPAGRSAAAFALLALAALAGFWPGYLSRLGAAAWPVLIHVHALLMALWCGLLIAQPWLVRRGRLAWHRQLGRLAWVLAPAIVVSSLLLAVAMTRPAAGAAIEPFRYALFFVQIATSTSFAACVAVALVRRRQLAWHARSMVASGLCFIDPVLARVFAHAAPAGSMLAEYGSIALACAVVLALRVADRRSAAGRAVWGWLLAALLLIGAGGAWLGEVAPWRRLLEAAFT